MKERWKALSYRGQCTIRALLGVAAAPFVVIHGKSLFEPHLSAGGGKAILTWIGLISIYYLTARAAADLFTDGVDWKNNNYSLRGGNIKEIDERRTNAPPYDMLQADDIKRDWSTWQYVLASWWIVETGISLFAVFSVLASIQHMKYYIVDGAGFCAMRHYAAILTCGLGEWVYAMSYFLIYFSISSMVNRNNAGIIPLPLRLLGLPCYYPGQNVSPRWLNELMIKLVGKPL